MSLVFCDGFDDGLYNSKWNLFTGTSIVAGRTGNCMRIAASGSLGKIVPASYEHNTFIVGFALRVTSFVTASTIDIFQLRSDSNTTTHMAFNISSAGVLTAQRQGAFVVGPSISINLNTWYYIELKTLLSDTVGTIEWRLDGVTMFSGTNLDTKNAGTKTVFDGIMFGSNTGLTYNVDDLYLCNGAGSVNNNFLGSIAVETIYPDNNGNSSQFVGSDADSVDNYLLVDETTPNTSDYVESATVGNKDTYSFANLTRTNGNVLAIQPTLYAQKSDAGARTAKLIARSSGTEGLSDVKSLNIGWGAHMYPFDQDPNGNVNWTIASANAAEFGFQVDS